MMRTHGCTSNTCTLRVFESNEFHQLKEFTLEFTSSSISSGRSRACLGPDIFHRDIPNPRMSHAGVKPEVRAVTWIYVGLNVGGDISRPHAIYWRRSRHRIPL